MDANPISAKLGQSLEELAQYIRETLPMSNTISEVHLNREAGLIEFRWQARSFIVMPSLNVFESKGKNLFITGASMLMQTVLGKRKGNTRVVESMMDSIEKAEDLIAARRFEAASTLLDSVKKALKRETGILG